MRAILLAALVVSGLSACGQKTATSAPAPSYDLSAASNKKYLADFAAKPGTVKLPDGLEYRVIRKGNGRMPTNGDDEVTVTYKGYLINGKLFDQTKPGMPVSFPAGGLILGWVEALSLMREGDEWQLVIPSDLGYGPAGAGNGVIPGGQTLVFDMTLVAVKPAQ